MMARIPAGSFLMGSDDFYCLRYRPAARQMPDTSTSHLGFRCVTRD